MKRSRILLTASIASALVISALGAPAAAVDKGRMIIVNGRPWTKAEICINGKEVKSDLKYGRYTVRRQVAGAKILKMKKKSAGNCTGKLLAKKTVSLIAGKDLTIVFTKNTPDKVLAFDDDLGPVVVRHAADIGTAGFKYAFPSDGNPWIPAADSLPAVDSPYEKGDYGWGGWTDFDLVWWAHQPPDQEVLYGPWLMNPDVGRQHEEVLVGTTANNVRVVHVEVAS